MPANGGSNIWKTSWPRTLATAANRLRPMGFKNLRPRAYGKRARAPRAGNPVMHARRSRWSRSQLHDLPPLRLIVPEHQAESKVCACGHTNKAVFPEGVNAPVQYGSGVKATHRV